MRRRPLPAPTTPPSRTPHSPHCRVSRLPTSIIPSTVRDLVPSLFVISSLPASSRPASCLRQSPRYSLGSTTRGLEESIADGYGRTGSSTKKWFIIFWYCLLQAFVTLTTTTYVSAEFLVRETYGGSTQVVALGQSMFIIGTAVGPAFLGPLSYVSAPNPTDRLPPTAAALTLLYRDINGRKWVYVGAIFVYAILNIGCAKALNLPMLVIFQFLCGAAGSVALCNVAGTIADLFGDSDGAGQPSKELPVGRPARCACMALTQILP